MHERILAALVIVACLAGAYYARDNNQTLKTRAVLTCTLANIIRGNLYVAATTDPSLEARKQYAERRKEITVEVRSALGDKCKLKGPELPRSNPDKQGSMR